MATVQGYWIGYLFASFAVGVACLGVAVGLAVRRRDAVSRAFLGVYAAVTIMVTASLMLAFADTAPDMISAPVRDVLQYLESIVGFYGIMLTLPLFAHRVFAIDDPRRERILVAAVLATLGLQHVTEFALGSTRWDERGDWLEDGVMILRDRPPTLVISGINGGPNLGAGWMFSGTIGAARVAALAGFPAVAVSGLDDDVPGAVEAAVDWVVRFAEHSAVREMEPGEYLTVSLPPGGPSEVSGVRIADRAPLHRGPSLDHDETLGVWKITGMDTRGVSLSAIADERLHADGAIVVVPMRANEVDGTRLLDWLRSNPGLPAWRPAERKR